MTGGPRIVVIGGGTGSFTLLSDLKKHTENITALVNMADDGGSTGVLRDELGVLPPGDVRQCLVALSDSSKLRDLFNYRFSEGSLDGHSFGNLFLSAVEKMTNNFEEAIRVAGEALQIRGQVLPVTTDDAKLVLTKKDGSRVEGEFEIGHLDFKGERSELSLTPPAQLTESGKEAIQEADLVVIAPGSLYGSLAPALLVGGMNQALLQTKAKVVYVCNLATKPGQTDGFGVADYADEIERFIGDEVLDFVVYNTEKPPKGLTERYVRNGEILIEGGEDDLSQRHYEAIGEKLIAGEEIVHTEGDKLASSRSLIRHDAAAVSEQLMAIIKD